VSVCMLRFWLLVGFSVLFGGVGRRRGFDFPWLVRAFSERVFVDWVLAAVATSGFSWGGRWGLLPLGWKVGLSPACIRSMKRIDHA